jgi:hypothetical protein
MDRPHLKPGDESHCVYIDSGFFCMLHAALAFMIMSPVAYHVYKRVHL